MKYQAEALQRGETVQFRPRGHSMKPMIHSGELVTLRPLGGQEVPVIGDVVLCKIKGRLLLHKVGATKTMKGGFRYRIENAKGSINGWIPISRIYGKVTEVGP